MSKTQNNEANESTLFELDFDRSKAMQMANVGQCARLRDRALQCGNIQKAFELIEEQRMWESALLLEDISEEEIMSW